MIDMKDFEKILKTQEESSKKVPPVDHKVEPVEEKPDQADAKEPEAGQDD